MFNYELQVSMNFFASLFYLESSKHASLNITLEIVAFVSLLCVHLVSRCVLVHAQYQCGDGSGRRHAGAGLFCHLMGSGDQTLIIRVSSKCFFLISLPVAP